MLSNRPVNSPRRCLSPLVTCAFAVADNPEQANNGRLTTCLTEPPPSGFIMPVVTMAPARLG